MEPGGLARGVFVGALALTAFLERLQFQLKATEASTWWASNGRDVLNGFSLATLGMGAHFLGFAGPECLLVGGVLVILLTAVQAVLERWRHATSGSMLASFCLGAPVALEPERVHGWLQWSLSCLF